MLKSAIFFNEFRRYIVRLLSFLGVKVFYFFNFKGFCYFFEIKIRFFYLINMIFDYSNARFLHFLMVMVDVKEFVLNVVTLLMLCTSIPRFGTMLKKKLT